MGFEFLSYFIDLFISLFLNLVSDGFGELFLQGFLDELLIFVSLFLDFLSYAFREHFPESFSYPVLDFFYVLFGITGEFLEPFVQPFNNLKTPPLHIFPGTFRYPVCK